MGHAVRATYLEAGVVDVAVETDDAQLLESSLIRWHDMVTKKLYLTGGVGLAPQERGLRRPLRTPSRSRLLRNLRRDRQHSLVVAVAPRDRSVEIRRSHRAHDLQRTRSRGRRIDGKSFFYSNPLQVRADHEASDEEESGRRLPWYRCACCPPNLMRAFASLPHYIAQRTDAGLQLHQFTSASVHAELGCGRGRARHHHWLSRRRGRSTIVVRRSIPQRWVLSVRVPSWADAGMRAWVDDEAVSSTRSETGYLETRQGVDSRQPRSYVEVPVKPRITVGNPRVDADTRLRCDRVRPARVLRRGGRQSRRRTRRLVDRHGGQSGRSTTGRVAVAGTRRLRIRCPSTSRWRALPERARATGRWCRAS